MASRRASLARFFSGARLVARFGDALLNSTPGLCPINPTRTYRILILLADNALGVLVNRPPRAARRSRGHGGSPCRRGVLGLGLAPGAFVHRGIGGQPQQIPALSGRVPLLPRFLRIPYKTGAVRRASARKGGGFLRRTGSLFAGKRSSAACRWRARAPRIR